MDVTRRNVIEAAAGLVVASAARASTEPLSGRLAGIEQLVDATRTGAPDLGQLLTRYLPGLSRGGVAARHLPDMPPAAGTTKVPRS